MERHGKASEYISPLHLCCLLFLDQVMEQEKKTWPYCKIRNEGPLLDRLVVGGLAPD